MDESIDSQAQQPLSTKKKKTKLTKKHKQRQQIENEQIILQQKNQIETTNETITTTKTKINEQSMIEHKNAFEIQESIKQIPLDVAPEHIETLSFEENTIPIETDTQAKSIEILPIHHPSNVIHVASAFESETQLNSMNIQKQIGSIKLNECVPLYITDFNQTESTGIQKSNEMSTSNIVTSTFVTSSSTVDSEIVTCDTIDSLKMESVTETKLAESSCIPFESKIVSELIVNTKESSLITESSPISKFAIESFDTQNPIKVEEVGVDESTINLNDNYEPKITAPEFEIISNESVNVQETFVQNTPTKFYPETFIATEEALPKYVEQKPYQTQMVCTSELESTLNIEKIPDTKQVNVEFSKQQAISVEQANLKESVTDYSAPEHLKVKAKDSLSFYNELQTDYSQAIDTSEPTEPFAYKAQSAELSMIDFDSKIEESTNVFQSEQPFDVKKPSQMHGAILEIAPHEIFTISEIQTHEHDTQLIIEPTTSVKANKSEEPHKRTDSNYEQLLETTDIYEMKAKEHVANAQIDFELQKSTVDEITLIHDSERQFDTKQLGQHMPQYSSDTSVNNPIMITETQANECDSIFNTETPILINAVKMHEPFHTFESHTEQLLDTTTVHHIQSRDEQISAQNIVEPQKLAITEIMQTHDSESKFYVKLQEKIPHYTMNTDVNSSIIVSEAQINLSEDKLNIKKENKQKLSIVETPKNLMRLGTVSETLLCESAQQFDSDAEKGVHANRKSTISHEISIETNDILDNYERLDIKDNDLKKATPNVQTQNALQISMETAPESLNQIDTNVRDHNERFANLKEEFPSNNPLQVDEVEPIEYSAELNKQIGPMESFAKVLASSHMETNVAEMWPMENTENFIETPTFTDHLTTQNILERSAIQVFTEIASDSLKDFERIRATTANSKLSVEEMKSLTTEHILTHEHTEPTSIPSIEGMLVKGNQRDDLDVQHRCEQSKMDMYEYSDNFDETPIRESNTISKISETLTSASINEIQVNSSAGFLDDFVSGENHAKYTQEAFNMIGQSMECVPLDSETEMVVKPKIQGKQSKMSIEEMVSYDTNIENILEKESENVMDIPKDVRISEQKSSHFLGVANVTENISLCSETSEIHSDEKQNYAITKYDTWLESVKSEDIVLHEMVVPSPEQQIESRTAKTMIDYKKPMNIEFTETFENAEHFEEKTVIDKQCEQTLTDYLKAPITQMPQLFEQIQPKMPDQKRNEIVNQTIEQINQSLVLETVSMIDENIPNVVAHEISDKATMAVQIMEQYPLQKEINLRESNTNKLLTKSKIVTQESNLNYVNRESEVANIQQDIENRKITNKKIERILMDETGETKGR